MESGRTGGWAAQYWNKPEIKGFDCLQCNLLHLCSCSMEQFLQTPSSTRNHHAPHEPILHVFYPVFVPIYYFLPCKWQGYMSFAFSHKWGCFSTSIVLKTANAPLSAWNLHCRSFPVRFTVSNLITNHTYRNLHTKQHVTMTMEIQLFQVKH